MSIETREAIGAIKEIRGRQITRRMKMKGRDSQPIINVAKTLNSLWLLFRDTSFLTDSTELHYVDHGVTKNKEFKSINEIHQKKIFEFFLNAVFSPLLFVFNMIEDVDYVYKYGYQVEVTDSSVTQKKTEYYYCVFCFRNLATEIDVFYEGQSDPVKFSLAKRYDDEDEPIDDSSLDCEYLKFRGIFYSLLSTMIHKNANACIKQSLYNSLYSFMSNISSDTFRNKDYCFNKSFYAIEKLEDKLKIINDLKYIFGFLGDNGDEKKKDIEEFNKLNLQWFKY